MAHQNLDDARSFKTYNTLMKDQKAFNVGGPAPLDYTITSGMKSKPFRMYDGLTIHPGGESQWRHPPSETPKQSGKFFVPQGHGVPLRYESQASTIPDDTMFYFARNYSSPSCCPSTFSTSTGCVCTNKKQRDYVGVRRGGNVDAGSNPPI